MEYSDDGIDDMTDDQLQRLAHIATRTRLQRARNRDWAAKQYGSAIMAELSRLFDYLVQGAENAAGKMRDWGERMQVLLEELRRRG